MASCSNSQDKERDLLVIKLFFTTCTLNCSVLISVLATTPSFHNNMNTTDIRNNNCLLMYMFYVLHNYSHFASLLTLVKELWPQKQTFIIICFPCFLHHIYLLSYWYVLSADPHVRLAAKYIFTVYQVACCQDRTVSIC